MYKITYGKRVQMSNCPLQNSCQVALVVIGGDMATSGFRLKAFMMPSSGFRWVPGDQKPNASGVSSSAGRKRITSEGIKTRA